MEKHLKYLLITLLITGLFIGVVYANDNVISNIESSAITNDSAKISYDINESSDYNKTRIYYGIDESDLDEISGWSNESPYKVVLENLDENTKYYYLISAKNYTDISDHVNSSIKEFTTAMVPIIKSINVDPSYTNAKIDFDVDPDNSEVNISYGTDENDLNKESGWISELPYEFTGLDDSTKYHYKISSRSSVNSSYSNETATFNFTTLTPSAPEFIISPYNDTPGLDNVVINYKVNQSDAKTEVRYGTNSSLDPYEYVTSNDSRIHNVSLTGLQDSTTYHYQVFAYNGTNSSYYDNSTILSFETSTPIAPNVSQVTDEEITHESATIKFNVDQEDAKTQVRYGTNSSLATYESKWDNSTDSNSRQISVSNLDDNTRYYYQVFAYNKVNESFFNSTDIKDFTTLSVSGNRIWEEGMSLLYRWDAKSFSGFYYDLDAGLSSESMEITLSQGSRTVGDRDLKYTTEPIMIDFEHDGFGQYQAVGFMADRYFAGFTAAETNFLTDDVSMMADGQLSKVLIDSDDGISVSTGSSLVLEEGYSINIVELDVSGDSLFLTLTKDGQEVDSDILSSDDFYVYEKDIGSTDDVPLIAVHIGNIFMGTESNLVSIDGIFQISEDYVSIEEGEKFGKLEITSISDDRIEMRNDGRFTLSSGSTIDLMGDVKIEVADSGTLRFAPFVDITEPGKHEIRGTVAENEGLEWTPLNFEGFYYDIDEGLMTESLTLGYSGRLIDSGNLTYETNPVEVNFEHSDFGKYQVIGFMAEKYFAGFTGADTEFVDDDISMIADGQLSKVLLDNDDRRTLYTGSSLVLEEGYTLNMQQIDIDGNQVWVSLRKDGSEVDDAILEAGSTYVYEKDLGSAEDVPIIAVQLQSVLRAPEVNVLFIEGIFQISEDYLLIEEGDTFGEMEVDTISPTSIVMTNDDNINLRTGRTIDLMGDIKFKVADDSDNVRYYPFVEREIAGDSLYLDIPSTISQDETITIKVTSRGASVNDATVKFDGQEIGTTDREGELRHNPESAGTFEVRAEKSGYIPATGNIEVIDPDDEGRRMSIEVSPDEIFEGQSIDVRIVSAIGAEPMEDVEVFYDGSSRGTTDEDGRVSSWTVTEPGIHRITATKEGYLDEEKTIEVIALEAEFDYSNLVISPEEVREGRDVTITADVENIGTDAGEYNIELRIDGNVTDSKTVYLEVDEQTTIEFVHTAGEPGNYTVEIGDLEGTFEVTEGLSIVWYVAGVIIVAGGAAAAYMFTAGGWTVEMVKARLAELIETIRSKR